MTDHIDIEWLEDSNNCDTCGLNWASGARVKLNGVVILDLQPHASCFGGDDWTVQDVFRELLAELGYSVTDG